MTEQQLLDAGFHKVMVPVTESGNKKDYYYYALNINKNISFLSCANDEAVDNNWSVNIDMLEDIEVKDMQELEVFINLIKKWVVNQTTG